MKTFFQVRLTFDLADANVSFSQRDDHLRHIAESLGEHDVLWRENIHTSKPLGLRAKTRRQHSDIQGWLFELHDQRLERVRKSATKPDGTVIFEHPLQYDDFENRVIGTVIFMSNYVQRDTLTDALNRYAASIETRIKARVHVDICNQWMTQEPKTN